MSSTTLEQRTHPLAGFSTRLHAVLETLIDTPAWSMTPDEQRATLIGLTSAQSRLDELRLRVLAAADRSDIAADTAATSTAAWLAHHTRTPRAAAHADVKLALRLDTDRTATRTALAAGHLDLQQARVITSALETLPTDATLDIRDRAETHLINLAVDHDAPALKILARRIHDVIDPDAAEQAEGRRLEKEEAAAARATYFHLRDNRDGTHTGRFRIPTLHAAALIKALHAFTNPRHRNASAKTEQTGTGTSTGASTTGTTGAASAAAAAAGPTAAPAPAPTSAPTSAPSAAATADSPTSPTTPSTPEHVDTWSSTRLGAATAAPETAPGQDPSDDDTDTDTDAVDVEAEAEVEVDSGAQPQESSADPDTDRIVRTSRPELLGTAFCELLERLPRTLPHAGGVTATVVVHLDYDMLLAGLGTAHLDTGECISASQARRLACQGGGIIPAVLRHALDGTSEVLDLGRERRFHTRVQRIALGITQGGCTADGCDRSVGWCQAHHPVPWSQGGSTSVTNGRLLCPYHHGKAHSSGYRSTELPTGKIAFTRRT